MLASHARFLASGAWALALITVGPFAPSAFAAKSAPAQPAPPRSAPETQAKMDMSGAVALASHRAVYELTLSKSVGSKSPTAAHGRIAFDFAGSPCEGYVQNFRQLTELQPAEGPTRVSDMHSATFEDPDGKSFDFKMRTSVDDGAAEAVDGKASKIANGPLSVHLAKPKRSKFDLAPDIAFPTEHLRRILAAAQAGKSSIEVKVFDGSETGEKVYETTTFIGHPIAAPVIEQAAKIPVLENMRRWPVSISYFDAGKKDDGPSYTLSFDLYENGISRALKLDYGDFVLAGEMSSLELLNEPACHK
ncbi:cell envelope integrity EipB family protein [Methylocapsa aurea]|uniref:cell envelope integrity EipB family protein n=1 Tax=Methylocapsa aurea TaxID=663610 RepID=UPI000561AD81|nr:cell envelope integrity EipB family protein [Methylocapsa aurea]